MKKALIVIMLLCSCFCRAQNDDKLLLTNFKVMDAFYETFLSEACVSVMEMDSSTVLVDSMFVSDGFFAVVPRREVYVLRIACEYYPTTYTTIKIPKRTKGKYLISTPTYIYQKMDRQLSEVTVKASRILMVVKGDTIEYNAAAFRMAEGSMLDNLVRALPGVKLDDNGRITVNGEFVSSLLVNGRDFFNGDPQVALSNLPAYTVHKIRTYHKSERAGFMGKTELTETEKKESPLVMDVSLKREYAKGWISNYELGGGTGINGDFGMKWLGRLFAMRYTNHSSLAFFAGSNNLNDAMNVSTKGEWKRIDATEGERKTYMAGINFTLDPKDIPLKFATALQVNQQRHTGEIKENVEEDYGAITAFRRSTTHNQRTNTNVKWNGNLAWSKNRLYLRFEPLVSYFSNSGSDCISSVAEQSSESEGVEINTLYQRRIKEKTRGQIFDMGAVLFSFIMLPKHQMIDISQKINYSNTHRHHYINENLNYAVSSQEGNVEYRDRNRPISEYVYSGNILYQNYEAIKKGEFKLRAFFNYKLDQNHSSVRQELLRADEEGLVPSAERSREWLIDTENSYHTTCTNRTHTFDPYLDIIWGGAYFSAHATMYAYKRNIEDIRAENIQNKEIRDFTFDPRITLGWKNKEHAIELGGSIRNELPEMAYVLDVTDSTDPLIVQKGNPNLKSALQQSVYLSYKLSTRRHAQRLNLYAEYNCWKNKVAMAQLYDNRTGITTYMPMNVNGNSFFDIRTNYSTSIGKAGNWSISNEFGVSLARSADISSTFSVPELRTNNVRNTIIKEDFRLDYRINRMRLGTKVTFSWTGQYSEQDLFAYRKYGTQGYGITFSSPVCWGIDLDTDFMVYKRFGYSDVSMNTTDWVWNASLMKGLGRSRQWIVKAVAFDILRQLSNVRRDINAQGYVERRYNTMPSYVLLSVMYRLDIKPKGGR